MKRFKYLIRKFKYSRKRTYTFGVLFLMLFGLGIGYAFVTTTLNITGALGVASSSWDVHFENIEINDESVEAETDPTITDNTTISFSATLEDPGDMYEYTVDIVNDGTYDAKIDSFTITPTLTSEQQEYFEYEVKYTEGGNIQVGDALNAGESENIKVYFKYKENEDSSKYPGEDTEFNFSLTLNYIQGKGTTVDHTTLYSVLKTAAKDDYSREYTGEHHDSFTVEPSKKIYYWYGYYNNEVSSRANVIFANQCWQTIRTTDTGGVKMIYNGEAEDGKCLDTRGNHVGYATRTTQALATTYYYGTSYAYDKTNNVFSLDGTITTGTINEGEYTCKSNSEDGTCSTLYLVDKVNSGTSYYVIPLNGNSHYSQFGKVQFNSGNNSPGYVGYKYGDVYTYKTGPSLKGTKSFNTSKTLLSSTSFAATYKYSKTINYTGSTYELVDPILGSEIPESDYSGYYTYRSATTTSGAQPYYLAGKNSGSNYYYVRLSATSQLSDFYLLLGDSIADSGNGSYTLNNAVSVSPTDWIANYGNYKNKYTCGDALTTTCTTPQFLISSSKTSYSYVNAGEKVLIAKSRTGLTLTDTLLVKKDEWYNNYSSYGDYKYTCNTDSNICTDSSLLMITSFNEKGYDYNYNYYYGSSVTWDGTNYTLVNPVVVEDPIYADSLSNHHYMCLTYGATSCTTVAYVYFYTGSSTISYIELANGVIGIQQAMNNMFTKNTSNSIIKTAIDAWYQRYLLSYDEYIEDTIFCNDRSYYQLGGWDSNGGVTNQYLRFNPYRIICDYSCANATDKFSVSNSSAQLTYKVGLMTSAEMLYFTNLRKTGQAYWLLSPDFTNGTTVFSHYISSSGYLTEGDTGGSGTTTSNGVRPAISLKPGTKYSSGSGSKEDPFIIE